MSSIVNSSTFLQGASLVIHKEYSNSASEKTLQYNKLFNSYEGDDERRFVQFLNLVGFGTLFLRPEGQAPHFDTPSEGNRYQVTYRTWALGYRVTKEMMLEDPKRIIKQLPKQLRYSSDQTKERLFWSILNYAFSAAVPYADGQPLCSYNHPLQGASSVPGVNSYSNYLGNAPFTVETAQEAQYLMVTIPNDRALLTTRRPERLVYPIGMHQVALEVTGSGYRPGENTNTVNVAGGSFELMPTDYLNAPLNGPFPWFVCAPMGQPGDPGHSMFYSIKYDTQKSNVDPYTESILHKTEFREIHGVVDARGVVGSAG